MCELRPRGGGRECLTSTPTPRRRFRIRVVQEYDCYGEPEALRQQLAAREPARILADEYRALPIPASRRASIVEEAL